MSNGSTLLRGAANTPQGVRSVEVVLDWTACDHPGCRVVILDDMSSRRGWTFGGTRDLCPMHAVALPSPRDGGG